MNTKILGLGLTMVGVQAYIFYLQMQAQTYPLFWGLITLLLWIAIIVAIAQDVKYNNRSAGWIVGAVIFASLTAIAYSLSSDNN